MLETAADRQSYLQAFGESATWTKSDSTTSTVSIVFHALYSDEGASIATYVVQASQEELGLAKLRETLTINGITYVIADVRYDGSNWLEIQLDK